MTKRVFLLSSLLLFSKISHSQECLGWFLSSGLAGKTSDCELKCIVTPVDMGSFLCPNSCEELCSKSAADHLLKYAPRLTEVDKTVVSKMPYEALKVFVEKERADNLTEKVFKSPSKNDESDAFRHFVWSVLVAKEIGEDKAKIFLNAHEEDSTQTSAEKQMDLANNSTGLEFFSKSKKANVRLDLNEIEKEALNQLRDKKLKVLESKYKQIPGGYYSK